MSSIEVFQVDGSHQEISAAQSPYKSSALENFFGQEGGKDVAGLESKQKCRRHCRSGYCQCQEA